LQDSPAAATSHASIVLQDLSSWTRAELQDKCRENGLYAGGSKQQLEERLVDALVPGTTLSVFFPGRGKWREGFITRILFDE
jgi:hypothetical protein